MDDLLFRLRDTALKVYDAKIATRVFLDPTGLRVQSIYRGRECNTIIPWDEFAEASINLVPLVMERDHEKLRNAAPP